MEISQTKLVPVQAKTLLIHLKVSDGFCAHILDENRKELGGQDDGYVPDFMPGEHYGDYVILEVDIDTGHIANWRKPSKEAIEAFIARRVVACGDFR